MDEDLVLREIVKNLTFEIEAVNQDNVVRWTTTNGTPLNVKVRVRNKDEPKVTQRGSVPVPRIGINAPDTLRLVSSEQTILSFNVYLEDQLKKQEAQKRRSGFKLFSIGNCLGTYSDDEGPYLPGSSKEKALASITSSTHSEKVTKLFGTANTLAPRNQKGFFGKCKPGGCLDPPFGEDQYPYTVPKTDRQEKHVLGLSKLDNNKQALKPGGCLDPPFGEDRYPYALPKTDRQEKFVLERSKLDDKIQALIPGGRLRRPYSEEKCIYTRSKTDLEKTLEREHHELEDRKETDIISKGSDESGRKPQEKVSLHRTSAQETTKDDFDSKRLMDIYARTPRENTLAYSESLITYTTDTSSTESLVDQTHSKIIPIQSYDQSPKQIYDYPESYFMPPKDVLKYKEEERRYSRELSNFKIAGSSQLKINDMLDKTKLIKTEVVDYEPVPQNVRDDKNMQRIKLTLNELQPDNIDVAHKLIENKALTTHFIPSPKEPEPHIMVDSKKVDDSLNVCDEANQSPLSITSKRSFSNKEIEHTDIQQQQISQSYTEKANSNSKNLEENVVIANIMSKQGAPIKMFATKKIESRILDEKQHLYPDANEGNIGVEETILSPAYTNNSFPGKKTLELSTNKETLNKKDVIPAPQPNAIEETVSSGQVNSNDSDNHEQQTLAVTYSYQTLITEQKLKSPLCPERNEKEEEASVILESPHMQIVESPDAQIRNKDVYKRISEKNKVSSTEVFVQNNSFSISPAQNKIEKFVDSDPKSSGKEGVDSIKQTAQDLAKLKISKRDPIPKDNNFDQAVDTNDDKIIRSERQEVASVTIPMMVAATNAMFEEQSLIPNDKSNVMSVTKPNEKDIAPLTTEKDIPSLRPIYPQAQEVSSQKHEWKQKAKAKKNDVSSARKTDLKQKGLSNGEINAKVDTVGKQVKLDNVLIQKNLLKDNDIELSRETQEKRSSAILQKTASIPRRDSHIHKDDISKITPRKLNTFTIIGSDTSLQKQKEIEQIPENVTNVYPKIPDKTKSVPLSQTYDKTEILDGRSKNQEKNNNLESTEKQLQKTIQTIVKDAHSKITDDTELLDTSNKMHDTSIFRPQTPMREQKGDLFTGISYNNASVPSTQISEKVESLSTAIEKSDSSLDISQELVLLQKQKEIEQIPENVTNVYPKILDKSKSVPLSQTYGKTEILDRRSKNQENKIYSESSLKQSQKAIQTNVKDVYSKIADGTELLDTSNKIHDTSILGLQTPMPEQKGDLFTAISYNNASVPSTQISEKAESLRTAIEKSDSSSVISQKLVLLQKQKGIEQIPENVTYVYPKIPDKSKSVPLSPTYEKTEILDGRSKNQDKNNNSESTEKQLQKTIQTNVKDVYSKITDKTELLDASNKIHDSSILGPQTPMREQKGDLFTGISYNNASVPSTQISEKAETLSTAIKKSDSSSDISPELVLLQKQKEIEQIPEKVTNVCPKIPDQTKADPLSQTYDKTEILDGRSKNQDKNNNSESTEKQLQKTIQTNVKDVYSKITDKTELLDASNKIHDSSILGPQTPMREQKGDLFTGISYNNASVPSTQISEKAETLSTAIKKSDSSSDISPELVLLQKQKEIEQIPEKVTNVCPKIPDQTKADPLSQTYDKTEILDGRSKNQDKNNNSESTEKQLQKTIQTNVKDVYSKITDKTELLDASNKIHDSSILGPQTPMREQKGDLFTGISYNNASVPSTQISEKAETLSTAIKKSDSSSDISPELVLLQKQKEIEQIPEKVTNVCPKIPDQTKADPLSQTYDKTEILDGRSKNQDKNNNSESTEKQLQKTIQTNVKDVYSKITEKTELLDASNKIHDSSILGPQTPMREQKGDLFTGISYNNASVPSTQISEKAETLSTAIEKSDSSSDISPELVLLQKQKEIEQIPEKVTNVCPKIPDQTKADPLSQTYDKTEILDGRSKNQENKINSESSVKLSQKAIQTNVKDVYSKITDETELLDTSNKKQSSIFGPQIPIPEQKGDLFTGISYNNASVPSTQISEKAETLSTAIEKSDSSADILPKLVLEKISKLHLKFTDKSVHRGLNLDWSPKPTIEHIKYLRSTDDNKSALISQIRDKREKIFTEQGKTAQSVTATDTSQKIIPENKNIIDDGIISPVAPTIDETDILIVNNGFVSSPKSILENERDLLPILITDDKSAQPTQHYDKPQSLDTEKKEIESNAIYVTPKIETNASLKIIDNFKFQPIAPRSDEPESKNKMHIDSTEPKVRDMPLIVIEENYDKRKVKDAKYEENLSPKVTSEIADDDYISAGETYDKINVLDTYSNQSYRIIDKAALKPTENVLSAQKFNLSNNVIPDHYVYSSKDQEHIEFSENLATLPLFNKGDIKTPEEFIGHELANNNSELKNITEIISEKSSPYSGFSGLVSEVLSNILENAEGEENKSTESTESDGSIGRDRNLSQVNALIVKDYPSLDSKLLKVPTEHGSILTTMFDGNIDHLSPKTNDGSYKVPGNTLVNASISTLKIKTDEDTLNEIVTEVLGSMQYTSSSFDQLRRQNDDFLTELSRTTNVDYVDNIIDAGDLQRENRLLNIPASISNISELNKDNFGTKPSHNISLEEAFKDYGHSFISKHKEKLSSSHRVIKEAQKQTPSANKMYFEAVDSISIKEDKSQIYLDMSFHSYINDNNQRVVQTHIPLEQQQHNDGTVTVVKTLLHLGNEIRIPVDKENDLALYILGKNSKISNRDNIVGSPTRYTRPLKHVIDRAKKREVMNKNLALIYESGLIPLHNVIKDLTQELNTLTAKQEILQERTRNAKCTKSLRLIPVVKRCRCKRN